MGKLILVPTPIGNLEDITLRALRVLKEADFILAEDTRKTNFLLKHYQIDTKVISHHKFNEHGTVSRVVQRLSDGENAALVSDAGTPGISDPGYLLVNRCLQSGIEVECLPGPTALIPAIVLAGLPNDRFVFEGFLPQKKGREKRFSQLKDEARAMVFYESPHRLVKTLKQCADHFGVDRQVAVCRELTKIYEEIKRGTATQLAAYYEANPPKGEIVIVVDGKR